MWKHAFIQDCPLFSNPFLLICCHCTQALSVIGLLELKQLSLRIKVFLISGFKGLMSVIVSNSYQQPKFGSKSKVRSVLAIFLFFWPSLSLSPSPRGLHHIRACSSGLLLDQDVPPDGILWRFSNKGPVIVKEIPLALLPFSCWFLSLGSVNQRADSLTLRRFLFSSASIWEENIVIYGMCYLISGEQFTWKESVNGGEPEEASNSSLL